LVEGRHVGPPPASGGVTRENLGFLLAKASQRWNELLYERFVAAGFPEVRPSYGSVLIPLYEEDGLRMGEIARRARLSKQTMTTLVRRVERDGLVERRADESDRRATRLFLTRRAKRLRPVAEQAVAALDQAAAAALRRDAHTELLDALQRLAGLDTGSGT
jgi:DNA-binding MarR family transcriptional regulator